MIVKTMYQCHFIQSILLFLSTYLTFIESTCVEDNTYIVYAGNERFPSTTEKTAELCQGRNVLKQASAPCSSLNI